MNKVDASDMAENIAGSGMNEVVQASGKGYRSTFDVEGHFARPVGEATLRRKSARGGLVTVVGQALRFAIQLASTAILARLLTPSDFGLFAMVAVIIGFMKLFTGQSLSLGIVQRDTIHHSQVSTFFWLNTGVALALCMLSAVLAPGVAWFFREPGIKWLVVVFSLQILCAGLAMPHIALLTRQMRFAALTRIDIVAGFISKVAGIVMAWLGTGCWALIAIPVSFDLLRLVMVWGTCRWRPAWSLRDEGGYALLRFGTRMTASYVLAYSSENVDNFLIGRVWGAQILGLYSKAYTVLLMPVRLLSWPLESVAISALSSLQHKGEAFVRHFHLLTETLFVILVPLAMFLVVAAEEVIMILLGSQWGESVLIFQALGLATLLGTMVHPLHWLLMSLGQSSRYLQLNLAANLLRTAAIMVGLSWGALGVAWGISIAMAFLLPFKAWFACRGSQISVMHYAQGCWRPVVAALVAGIGLWVFRASTGLWGEQLLVRLVLSATVFVVMYLLLLLALPGGMARLRLVLRGIKTLRQQG